ncbi:TetR/AcrR family transcriptional regulator [Amorphoplanes digitatis]|uniref:AcrR family transcriptional regulator n=1 Tax=Actinoplanes digitatis TaxID=1868 RepID=A0A7W7HWB6_9ACTN|nr:TetR/AcrR family transcriptional regulator [Actinoplanes digitatis]MBB4761965.1 AcrR family transcriptional regulator [Actinoplanes digitatis]GID91078.1 TetR family transcriptional regulator [Actinoplanes digitatis]
MIIAQHEAAAAAPEDAGDYRRRLLDGLAGSIVDVGYRNTTVADIVRRARTSRRTFYAHFPDREACYAALLADENRRMIDQITAAVDPAAPWTAQVRQAVEAWIACAESRPEITLSWIRDLPSLGAAARDLQRDRQEAFVTMIQALCATEAWSAVRAGPVSRQLAIMLLGGLRELTATTVEDGGRLRDNTEFAIRASAALLGPGPDLSPPPAH